MKEIYTRRSIRHFTDEKISNEDLIKVIKAGMNAPTGKNRQAWQFYIITDKEKIAGLKEIGRFWQPLSEAPQVILVCGDMSIFDQPYYHFINCAAAMQNMLLVTEGLGYGACWLGIAPDLHDCEKVRDYLNLPPEHLPIAMIAFGHKAQQKEPNDRFLADKIHYIE